MLTKSKSHWLYVHYHQGSGASRVVLRTDKKKHKDTLDSAQEQAGKEVEHLGNVKHRT
jgi:hypothetical protein